VLAQPAPSSRQGMTLPGQDANRTRNVSWRPPQAERVGSPHFPRLRREPEPETAIRRKRFHSDSPIGTGTGRSQQRPSRPERPALQCPFMIRTGTNRTVSPSESGLRDRLTPLSRENPGIGSSPLQRAVLPLRAPSAPLAERVGGSAFPFGFTSQPPQSESLPPGFRPIASTPWDI
jgi:hypothetical protein